MKITARKIAKAPDETLACMPVGNGQSLPLNEKERETLRFFPRLIINTERKALPLHIFLMSGSPKTLAIFPGPGGKINVKKETSIRSGEHELCIFPDPFPA